MLLLVRPCVLPCADTVCLFGSMSDHASKHYACPRVPDQVTDRQLSILSSRGGFFFFFFCIFSNQRLHISTLSDLSLFLSFYAFGY
jgi:hypothetical protein